MKAASQPLTKKILRVRFSVGSSRERGLKVGERERGLLRRVEGAEGRLYPALGQLLVADELAK
jgi:hypothetical protein